MYNKIIHVYTFIESISEFIEITRISHSAKHKLR